MIPEPGGQKPDAVLRARGAQEVVDLGVGVERCREVGVRADVRLDEVVAVHGRRHLDAWQSGAHELEQHDLRERVLQRDAVGVEVGVAPAPLELLRVRRRAGG